MKINLSPDTKIIVFTGPESTGKTTSAEKLSKALQVPLIEEYARTYLNINGPKYTKEDIVKIAHHQIDLEKDAHQSNTLIVCDTDLITLEIWSLEKYDESLDLNNDLLAAKHYILCYPDIPWEPDPLRENPNDRIRLFHFYKFYLNKMGAQYTILRGSDRNHLEISFDE